jgi:hypothetical protein
MQGDKSFWILHRHLYCRAAQTRQVATSSPKTTGLDPLQRNLVKILAFIVFGRLFGPFGFGLFRVCPYLSVI